VYLARVDAPFLHALLVFGRPLRGLLAELSASASASFACDIQPPERLQWSAECDKNCASDDRWVSHRDGVTHLRLRFQPAMDSINKRSDGLATMWRSRGISQPSNQAIRIIFLHMRQLPTFPTSIVAIAKIFRDRCGKSQRFGGHRCTLLRRGQNLLSPRRLPGQGSKPRDFSGLKRLIMGKCRLAKSRCDRVADECDPRSHGWLGAARARSSGLP
jgi:hypothetical protein